MFHNIIKQSRVSHSIPRVVGYITKENREITQGLNHCHRVVNTNINIQNQSVANHDYEKINNYNTLLKEFSKRLIDNKVLNSDHSESFIVNNENKESSSTRTVEDKKTLSPFKDVPKVTGKDKFATIHANNTIANLQRDAIERLSENREELNTVASDDRKYVEYAILPKKSERSLSNEVKHQRVFIERANNTANFQNLDPISHNKESQSYQDNNEIIYEEAPLCNLTTSISEKNTIFSDHDSNKVRFFFDKKGNRIVINDFQIPPDAYKAILDLDNKKILLQEVKRTIPDNYRIRLVSEKMIVFKKKHTGITHLLKSVFSPEYRSSLALTKSISSGKAELLLDHEMYKTAISHNLITIQKS